MPKKEEPTMAETVGKGFAYVQHGMDRAIEWGFQKMEESQTVKKTNKPIENPYLKTAADAGRATLGFLGKAGKAYYKKYEELKREK